MAKTRDEVREEALTAIKKYLRSGAAISMGVGKTRLGLEHFQLVVNKYQREEFRMAKALVVAPTKKIMKGWKDEIEKWGMEHLLDGLSFSTYRSLTKQDLDYDVIYLDECHSLKYSHDKWLKNYKNIIIGLTGTPPKGSVSEKAKMVNKYCPIRYTYLTDQAVNDNILNDYSITVHLLEMSDEKNYKVEIKNKEKRVIKSWYTSEKENYSYWDSKISETENIARRKKLSILRMKAMQTYPSKDEYAKKLLNESEVKTLLFANERQQADELCYHSYHSDNKDSEENMKMFESGEISKMSCVFQLSEGANIKELRNIIIMHMYGNNRKGPQRIGRALRLNPDDIAHIDILCYKDTIDFKWVNDALASFDQSKIEWYDASE